MSKRVTVLYGDSFLSEHSIKSIDVARGVYRSHITLLKGLRDYFTEDQLRYVSPDMIAVNNKALGLQNGVFIPGDAHSESDAFLIFTINADRSTFSPEFVKNMYGDCQARAPRVGRFVNPLSWGGFQDKLQLHQRMEEFMPQVIWSPSFEDLEAIVDQYGAVVVKPRFGQEGRGVVKITGENVANVKDVIGTDASEYIINPYIDAKAEKRLMLFGEKFCGARIIYGRRHPWEVKNKPHPDKRKEIYDPSAQELLAALEAKKRLGLDFCAVDFLEGFDGQQKMLEVNGVNPALMDSLSSGEIVYDCGRDLAELLYVLADNKE